MFNEVGDAVCDDARFATARSREKAKCRVPQRAGLLRVGHHLKILTGYRSKLASCLLVFKVVNTRRCAVTDLQAAGRMPQFHAIKVYPIWG